MENKKNECYKECICAEIIYYNGDKNVIDSAIILSGVAREVIIVDNGSSNNILNEEGELDAFQNIKIIRNERNMGVAYALNQGLSYANENGIPFLLTMDQDSIIDPESVERLVRGIRVNEQIISVGCFFGDKGGYRSDITANCLITSGNMMHVDSILKLGGFTDKLFIDCVDIDISFKILSAGLIMKKIGGTCLVHKIGCKEKSAIPFISVYSHSPIRFMFQTRNNIYIYRKYFKHLPLQCLKLLLSFLLMLMKVLFVEKNKKEKFHFVLLGIKQGTGIRKWDNDVSALNVH